METGTAADRDARMLELRRQGAPLAVIANEVGISRQGVQQRLRSLGGPTAGEARDAKLRRRAQAAEALAERIRADLAAHPGTTIDAIAGRLAVARSEVRKAFPPDLKAAVTTPLAGVTRWSDEQVLAAIRVAATFEYPLTTSKYDDLVLVGEVDGPTAVRVFQRFGTWTSACMAAGVEPPPSPRSDYQSRWTDQELLAFLKQYLGQTTTAGSLRGYDEWRRNEGMDAPSGTLIRLRFRSWTIAKQRALRDATPSDKNVDDAQGETQ